MKDVAGDDTVLERLRHALDGDQLPKNAHKHARQLIERLAAPVRVTLLGLPGSGKSELVNMFAGRRIVPTDMRLASMELVWGDTPRIVETSSDGRAVTHEGNDFNQISQDAAFLKVEAPIDILRRISLLEVVTDGSAGELSAAVDWAVRRTDIALWCSQEFNDTERVAWARVPDTLKDHAFIVLTKADVLSAERKLSQRVDDLEAIVAEEFHSLFAIATLQAIRSSGEDGKIDTALRHASGAQALSDEILRHAERGRRADLDSADLFLARYQIAPIPSEEPAEKVAPVQVTSPPPAASTPIAPPPAPDAVSINTALMREASQFLDRRAEGLERTLAGYDKGGAAKIVAQCINVVEDLTDQFSQDETGCVASDRMIDDLTEASDMMMLIQSEEGDAPAADAVTLLLQLKREMEMSLAA